jgi:hypothetical protein
MTTEITPAAPEAPAPTPASEEAKPAQAKPETDWKAEARKHEQRAKENAAAAAELAALKESQKTEAQKLADRVAAAEKERDDARLEALRVKVGAAKKLPADVVDLLKGDTEDELAAHADRLAEHFKQAVRPSGSIDQGQRGAALAATPAQEFAEFISKQMNQTG